eukprot:GFUD01021058.1.p1 GENE.GFUD01021058.1~~GFUD01021058.1.p1  ORF type:complete len:484 (-),score=149.92 GFUD01021058.1:72-1523(-)
MPEGPELHMAARFINQVAKYHNFGGGIVKSEVSTKNPDVEFDAKTYLISAETRGKELKVFLEDKKDSSKKTHILFRFGMSGCFKLTEIEDLPKHAHLRFFTLDQEPQQVLSFVDYRRFGRWEIEGKWGKDRGPDPIFDYQNFRQNVLKSLATAAFNRPICETLLNQKYFNGIGNYLRAEILYRAGIEPFTQAREVLEPLLEQEVKREGPDILELCNIVPKEVLSLDKGKNYDPDSEESGGSFTDWLRCYYVVGMKNLQDGKKRTIWFAGEPGPMVPVNARVVGKKGGTGSKVPKSGSGVEKVKSEPNEKKNIKKVKDEPKDQKKVKDQPEEKKTLKKVKDEPVEKTDVKKEVKKKGDKKEVKKEVKDEPKDQKKVKDQPEEKKTLKQVKDEPVEKTDVKKEVKRKGDKREVKDEPKDQKKVKDQPEEKKTSKQVKEKTDVKKEVKIKGNKREVKKEVEEDLPVPTKRSKRTNSAKSSNFYTED